MNRTTQDAAHAGRPVWAVAYHAAVTRGVRHGLSSLRPLVTGWLLMSGMAGAASLPTAGDGVKSMSKTQLIALALSAAPEPIARHAAVMIPSEGGALEEARAGSNGFVCLPDIDGQPVPDPICMDAAAFQWFRDLMTRQPKPTNTVPGIAYMAQGGWHREKGGKILLGTDEPGSRRVQEPPHWMLLWPFDSAASGLPTAPNGGGAYIMFDGTPYAHLMVYQDPRTFRRFEAH